MVFCSKCGKKVPDNAAFCPYCGAKTSIGSGVGVSYSSEDLREALAKMGEELEKTFETVGKELHEAFKTVREDVRKSARTDVIACQKCGEKNSSSAIFCSKCGTKLVKKQ